MRLPPAVLFLLAAGVQHAAVTWPRFSTPRLFTAASLVAVSVVMGLGALREFRRKGTTVDPVRVDRASSLVTSGVFGVTRNPMYLALVLLLAGHAAVRGAALAWVPVVGFVLALDRWQIPAEEAALRTHFGADFAGYTTRVRRWL